MLRTMFYGIFFLSALMCNAAKLSHKITLADDKTLHVKVFADLELDEYIYQDSFLISVDSPYIRLSEWHIDQPTEIVVESPSNTTKQVYKKPFYLTLFATRLDNTTQEETTIHIAYETNKELSPQHLVFALPFEKETHTQVPTLGKTSSLQTHVIKENPSHTKNMSSGKSWYDTLSDLVKKTQSLPLKLALVFLLGVLLSLTPCIYPMIPITAGILQAQKSSSLIYNFLLALSYTCGLSVTFAVLGLAAGLTGPLYGRLLTHPLSVGLVVSMLCYLAGSMFGFYDVHLPSFLRTKAHHMPQGSLLSIFMCGALSGTIASPCVSPGLIMLLSIVATLGSTALGFLLLFTFGVGLSFPLLLVGTFSGSLHLLPKAGSWMIEIKRLFGIMLIGSALYYLGNIVSTEIFFAILGICSLILGLFYLYQAQKIQGTWLSRFNFLLGSLFVMSATFIGVHHAQKAYLNENVHANIAWYTNYEQARTDAKSQNKLLFIDFWADYCSVCKAINKTILANKDVIETLHALTIPISIDGSDEENKNYDLLKEKYSIVGFPTFLLVDPANETVIHQWNSELYSAAPKDFIRQLHDQQ